MAIFWFDDEWIWLLWLLLLTMDVKGLSLLFLLKFMITREWRHGQHVSFYKMTHDFSEILTHFSLSSPNPIPYFVELRLQNILVIENWLKVTKIRKFCEENCIHFDINWKIESSYCRKTRHPVIIFKQPKFIIKIKKKHFWQVFLIVVGFKQLWDLKYSN